MSAPTLEASASTFPAFVYDAAVHRELAETAIHLVSALSGDADEDMGSSRYFAIREMEDAIERSRETGLHLGLLPELSAYLQKYLAPLALASAAAALQASQAHLAGGISAPAASVRVGQWYDTEGVIIPLTAIASWAMTAYTALFADAETLRRDALAQTPAREAVAGILAAASAL